MTRLITPLYTTLLILLSFTCSVSFKTTTTTFQNIKPIAFTIQQQHGLSLMQQRFSSTSTTRKFSTSTDNDIETTTTTTTTNTTKERLTTPRIPGSPACFYQREKGQWKRRLNIVDLEIGQKLYGLKIHGVDLLEAKTGPKIFFECGVGRTNKKGEWKIVNGMLRIGTPWSKKSVTAKRIARLSGKMLELYVSKIRVDNGQFEVCIKQEDALEEASGMKKMVSASTLQVGDELIGTVVRIEPYGVFVDVGANRKGLLHIQTVADLYKKFIDGEKGLIEAGLERGARIRVAVLKNEKKRLALDFTADVKADDSDDDAEKEKKVAVLEEEEEEEEAKNEDVVAEEEVDDSADDDDDYGYGNYEVDEDEAAAWAAYAAGGEDYDDDDEDRDIEDALGIGTY
mmetsp:Transcript_3210/g.4675  ORF Transcript_3210/g.4675 Transcript_3210/m.4675 type:complete len:398 (+) Transcript_3210:112-1305(+)